jgi:hypothetical protein
MRRLTLLLALALVALPALAPAASAAPAERATAAQQAANERLGTRLVTRFWELLKTGEPDELRAFLSPAFQVQRANGTGANRNQYVAALGRSIKITDYALSGFTVTRTGDLLVARYVVVTTETIDGAPYATSPVPRLSTFVKTPRGWRMASHANFNAPA